MRLADIPMEIIEAVREGRKAINQGGAMNNSPLREQYRSVRSRLLDLSQQQVKYSLELSWWIDHDVHMVRAILVLLATANVPERRYTAHTVSPDSTAINVERAETRAIGRALVYAGYPGMESER